MAPVKAVSHCCKLHNCVRSTCSNKHDIYLYVDNSKKDGLQSTQCNLPSMILESN
jgi:hypothetical protein